MKKYLIFAGIFIAILAITGTALVVHAQATTPDPETNETCPNWDGGAYGMFSHRGGMMGRGFAAKGFDCAGDGEYGPMHEIMVNLLAEATGQSVDEINNRLENGETMYDIITEANMTVEDWHNLMTQAREEFFNSPEFQDNEFFQQRMDRMQQRWSENGEEFVPGECPGGFGHGRGGFGGPMMQWAQPQF